MIKLSEASLEQLRAVAESKGLAGVATLGRDALLKKIASVFDGDEIPGEATTAAPAAKPVASKATVAGEEPVIVMIQQGHGEGGDQMVPLGSNGTFIAVPRGVWCRIKATYFESLKNAVELVYRQIKDENGLAKVGEKPEAVPRFPYQVWTGPGEPDGLLKPPETSADLATRLQQKKAA